MENGWVYLGNNTSLYCKSWVDYKGKGSDGFASSPEWSNSTSADYRFYKKVLLFQPSVPIQPSETFINVFYPTDDTSLAKYKSWIACRDLATKLGGRLVTVKEAANYVDTVFYNRGISPNTSASFGIANNGTHYTPVLLRDNFMHIGLDEEYPTLHKKAVHAKYLPNSKGKVFISIFVITSSPLTANNVSTAGVSDALLYVPLEIDLAKTPICKFLHVPIGNCNWSWTECNRFANCYGRLPYVSEMRDYFVVHENHKDFPITDNKKVGGWPCGSMRMTSMGLTDYLPKPSYPFDPTSYANDPKMSTLKTPLSAEVDPDGVLKSKLIPIFTHQFTTGAGRKKKDERFTGRIWAPLSDSEGDWFSYGYGPLYDLATPINIPFSGEREGSTQGKQYFNNYT
jgi:hypothetical protein